MAAEAPSAAAGAGGGAGAGDYAGAGHHGPSSEGVDACRIAYFFSAPLIHRTPSGRVSDVEPLNVKKELRHLQQCITHSGRQVTWSQNVATISNFRNAITLGCRVLHFTGHGMPGFVTFEDDNGCMFPLNATGLKELFEVGGGAEGVKFVFVSACHSQAVGQAFVAAGVPHVVAVRTSDAVLDDASLLFSHQFYTALLRGHPVAKAFNIGRMAVKWDPAIRGSHEHEEDKFLLLGDGDHDQPVFAHTPRGSITDETRHIVNRCDTVSDCFQGRAHDTYKIVKMLQESRCVTITGVYGIGKTQVALRVADFCAERHKFAEIFYVRLANPETGAMGLIHQFAAALKVDKGPADAFFAAVHRKFSGKDGHSFLLVVDGCEGHLQLGEPVLPEFLSHLAGKAGGMHFLLTSVQAIGYMSNLAEKPLPLGPLTPQDAAALFLYKAPRKLKFAEMGLTAGCSMGYRQVWAALARTPVLKALDGHPGAICQVVAKLVEKNPRDGMQYNLCLHELDFVRIIVPAVLRKYRANSARVLFNSVPSTPAAGMRVPALSHSTSAPPHREHPTTGLRAQMSAPMGGRPFPAAASPAASHPANVRPEVMAKLRHLLPNFATAEVWLAAHVAVAKSKASTLRPVPDDDGALGPASGAGAGAAAYPPVAGKLTHDISSFPATNPDLDYSDAVGSAIAGAGGGAGAGSSSAAGSGSGSGDADADSARSSMPPGPPGSGALAAARAAMPPGPPGAGLGSVSMFAPSKGRVTSPPPLPPRLASRAVSTPGGGHFPAAGKAKEPEFIDVNVATPLPWSAIAEQLQRKFSELVPRAAQRRPLTPANLRFIASSSKLSPVRGGLVTVAMFNTWWPKMAAWLRTMQRMQHLWVQRDPRIIQGWLNRDQANAMLARKSEGTFLFRFREGAPAELALCMVKGPQPQHVLVHVLQNGYELMTGAHSSIVFKSLDELVLRYRDLHFLYPAVPKASAFRM